jgi:uncharacterized protein DUF4157
MTHERDYLRERARTLDLDDHALRAPGRTSASSALSPPGAPVASGIVMRKGDGNGVAEGAEDAVAKAAGGSGTALPGPLMRKFEASLGADLSSVRVHTGADSAAAAQAVGARAYTLGEDIHFGAGQFDPASPGGEHLLAHEVAHTVQQRGGTPVRQHKLEVSTPHDAFEHEADRAADAMVRGSAFQVATAPMVAARNPDDDAQQQNDRQGRTTVTPGSSSGSKKPTPEQTAKLRSLQGKVSGLSGRAQTVSAALNAALHTAKGQLDQIDRDVASLLAKYDAAEKKFLAGLKAAGEAAEAEDKIKEAVIGMVVGAALGAVLAPLAVEGAALEALIEKAGVESGLAADWEGQKAVAKAVKTVAGAGDKAADAGADRAKEAAKGGGKDAASVDPKSKDKQIKALQQVGALKSQLLGAFDKKLEMGNIDTAVETTLRDIATYVEKGGGTSVSDPVDVVIDHATKLTAHAPAAYDAAAQATTSATKAAGKFAAVVGQAAEGASESQMLDKLWIDWIAGATDDKKKDLLDKLNGGILHTRQLPQHVIDMLGVKTGNMASDSDLNQQIMNAQALQRAQQMIGKTGIYVGGLNPHCKGTVTVDGSDFPADFLGFQEQMRNDPGEGTAQVMVVDARVFMDQPAGTGTGSTKVRQRFGITVRPIEASRPE